MNVQDLEQLQDQKPCHVVLAMVTVRSDQDKVFFTVQQTCPDCRGEGEVISKPCKDCRGAGIVKTKKTLSITIPKGVDDGTRIRLAGKGDAGYRGGSNGDLYVYISIVKHDIFREKRKIYILNFLYH